MTASMRLVHEGCGSVHFTVGGAGIDLRKSVAIASDGVHQRPITSPLRGITSRCKLEDPR
jgi:hypothetical protein